MTKGSLRKRVSLGFQFCDEGQRHGNKQQAWWEQDTSWKQGECQLAAGKTTPLKSPQTMSPTGAKCSNAQNYAGISQSNPHTQRCGDPFACTNVIAFIDSHSTCGFSSPPRPHALFASSGSEQSPDWTQYVAKSDLKLLGLLPLPLSWHCSYVVLGNQT